MEEARNGSENDNINCTREAFLQAAREMFQRLICHVQKQTNNGILWKRFATSTETDDFSQEECENQCAVQQHLISSVVFRWIELENGGEWELENIWDNVYARQLDDIGQKPTCEWHTVNYGGKRNIEAAMAENANIVLLRTIFDWSRPDGNVWSEQIVWSGSFADCHRVQQLLEDNSNSIQLRGERFDVNPHLRGQYIARHPTHPIAAAIAAVASCSTVIISDEFVSIDDADGDSLLCAICQETLSVGEDEAKQLPCNHLFHWNCILKWFYLKLECPLCRNQFQWHCSSE